MNNRPIGIFDSGIGGLTILSEAKKLLPGESFVYVADQANHPYGKKDEEQLMKLTADIVDFLVSKNVKLVIAACNTASVHTLDYLRQKYKIPIVGVVPVIKTIANISKTKKAAVFATPATVKSPYLQNLIDKYADGVEIYKVSGTGLEEIIEKGDFDNPKINAILNKHLLSLKEKNVDAIALGCTHYPIIEKQMKKIVGDWAKIVDSGGAVARRVKAVLENEDMLSGEKNEDLYYTTGDVEHFRALAQKILDKKTGNVYSLKL